jgi:hypothetical protein
MARQHRVARRLRSPHSRAWSSTAACCAILSTAVHRVRQRSCVRAMLGEFGHVVRWGVRCRAARLHYAALADPGKYVVFNPIDCSANSYAACTAVAGNNNYYWRFDPNTRRSAYAANRCYAAQCETETRPGWKRVGCGGVSPGQSVECTDLPLWRGKSGNIRLRPAPAAASWPSASPGSRGALPGSAPRTQDGRS